METLMFPFLQKEVVIFYKVNNLAIISWLLYVAPVCVHPSYIHFLDWKSKNSLVGEQGSYPNPDNSQCIMFQNLKNIHVF